MRERGDRPGPKQILTGSLLVAHPALRDPNFRRAVVLMSHHDDEGAVGVVLNRPAGQRLGELHGRFARGPLAAVPLFHGGPVHPKQLLLAAWQGREDGFKLHFGLEPERAAELLAEGNVELRGFLGYAGWTGGQLEGELAQNTWVVSAAPADLMRQSQDETLWRTILGGISLDWRLLADEPDDMGLN